MNPGLKQKYRAVGIGVELSQEANWLITASANHSERSKNKECLIRLEDHLKRFPVIDKSEYSSIARLKPLSEKAQAYKPVRVVVMLSAALNRLLTESTYKSGLSKSKEAAMRVNAHLMAFSSIAKVNDVTHRSTKGGASC